METAIWQPYQDNGVIMLGIINTSSQNQINNFVEENSTNNSPASNYYTDNYDYNVVWLVYVDPNKYEFSTFSNTTTLSQEVYNTVFYDFNEKINVNDIVIHHALSAKEQELFDSTSDSDNTTFDGDYVFWKVLEKIHDCC